MSIKPIVYKTRTICSLNNVQSNIEETKSKEYNNNSKTLKSVSGFKILSQLPNISFKRNYSGDDLSPYYDYTGSTPPEIEIEKFNISKEVQYSIDNEDYISAIQGKIELAKICHSQGEERDAYMLECSIRDLYSCLPSSNRSTAKGIIYKYNKDMAIYIDDDIKK